MVKLFLVVVNTTINSMSSESSICLQSRRKTREPKEENVTLGPTVREGEFVFGVAHIFASFNDTFIVSAICFSLCMSLFIIFPIVTVMV
jgi:hypothetical protein